MIKFLKHMFWHFFGKKPRDSLVAVYIGEISYWGYTLKEFKSGRRKVEVTPDHARLHAKFPIVQGWLYSGRPPKDADCLFDYRGDT